jgi:LPXTG-motif cell wall-anchored protein
MKVINRFLTLITAILGFPFFMTAQDEGTYIDNLGVQDSSYMETDLLNEGQGSGSGTVIIIVVVAVVILAAVFFFMKKKNKK